MGNCLFSGCSELYHVAGRCSPELCGICRLFIRHQISLYAGIAPKMGCEESQTDEGWALVIGKASTSNLRVRCLFLQLLG
jgi:hypothetical protein